MKRTSTKRELEPIEHQTTGSLAEEAREGDRAIINYARQARADILQMMQDRAKSVVQDPSAHGQADPFQSQLKALMRRLEDVENITRAFSVQTMPGCAPGSDEAYASMEMMVEAVSSLFAAELEARATQGRLAATAVVQEYAGVKRLRPQTLKFNVDYYLNDRFKRLMVRVKQERSRILGRSETLDPNVLLNLLVSLGEANVPAIVYLGCPDVAATFAVASLVAERGKCDRPLGKEA